MIEISAIEGGQKDVLHKEYHQKKNIWLAQKLKKLVWETNIKVDYTF